MPNISFKGKTFVQNHHLNVKFHELVPNADKSLNEQVSLYDNLIIEGDNLKALKALLPTYVGRIKCVVIVIYSRISDSILSSYRNNVCNILGDVG